MPAGREVGKCRLVWRRGKGLMDLLMLFPVLSSSGAESLSSDEKGTVILWNTALHMGLLRETPILWNGNANFITGGFKKQSVMP